MATFEQHLLLKHASSANAATAFLFGAAHLVQSHTCAVLFCRLCVHGTYDSGKETQLAARRTKPSRKLWRDISVMFNISI